MTVSVRYIVGDVEAAGGGYGAPSLRNSANWVPFTDPVSSAPELLQLTELAIADLVLIAAGATAMDAIDDRILQALRGDGARFRNDIVSGVGGKQILLEDPSGNPIELFEPSARPGT